MRTLRVRHLISYLFLIAVPAAAAAAGPAPKPAAKPAAAPQAPPAAPAPAPAAPAVPAPAPTTRRVELIGPDGKVFPYSVEIPNEWQVVPDNEAKGLWLAPAGVDPGKDPRSVFVRPSPADLRKPEETVRSIQENDKKDDTWAAPLVAVRDVSGVRGVVVQMDSGKGAAARSLLVLKLPVGGTSVDLMGIAPRALFASLRSSYEKILFSVKPLGK